MRCLVPYFRGSPDFYAARCAGADIIASIMKRLMIAWLFCGLMLASVLERPLQHEVTAAPNGPYHVLGDRILDAAGRPFLIRGTEVAEFRLDTLAYHSRSRQDFGAYSATALSAIRLRFNMNAVRIPLVEAKAKGPQYWNELDRLVRRANEVELLVILANREPGWAFSTTAEHFKDYSNVMFEASGEQLAAIRAAGARQPVIVVGEGAPLADDNVIYEVARDRQPAWLALRVPVLANDWDVRLEDAAACAALPADPQVVAETIQGNLRYFDAHAISWTVSSYEPGKLIEDNVRLDPTTLEDGWTCGKPAAEAGMGRVLQAYMRTAAERGLFVTGTAGGHDVSRGGYVVAYGPVMAGKDATARDGRHLPLKLGGLRVDVKDSRGVTRPAGVYWTAAGWGQINFVVPEEAATGPAQMIIVRDDGSRTIGNFIVTDTSPGFFTKVSCRGPAVGTVSEIFANGRERKQELSRCTVPGASGNSSPFGDCTALDVPVAKGAKTRVILRSSGLRYAANPSEIAVTIAGQPVRVVSYGPTDEPGVDQLTIEIPAEMQGVGETDLLCHVKGRVSNAVRIAIGGQTPAS